MVVMNCIQICQATALIPKEYQLSVEDIKAIQSQKEITPKKMLQYEFALQVGLIVTLADDSTPITFDEVNDNPALLSAFMTDLSPLISKFTKAFSSHAAVAIPSETIIELPMELPTEDGTLPPSN